MNTLMTAPHVWPNLVFALDQYIVTYPVTTVCVRTSANPMHARGIARQAVSDPADLLMKFFIMLGRAIDATSVSTLPYWEYLHSATTWSAETWFSTNDNPPPYLSSITQG